MQDINISEQMKLIILILLVFALMLLALFAKKRLLLSVYKGRERQQLRVDLISKGFTVLVVLIGLMFILNLLGLDIVPLLTFSGIGAAVLGFASQDVFANFFSGLMLYITRPFQFKEFIEVPNQKVLGDVEEIGWCVTTLRTPQKKIVYLPNSIFSKELIINHSRITSRRIEEKISLSFPKLDRLEGFVEEVRKLISSEKGLCNTKRVHLFVSSFQGDRAVLELQVDTRGRTHHEFMQIKQDLLIKIQQLYQKERI